MVIERILMVGVTEILKKLVPLVAKEIGYTWGVKNEFKKLERTLEMILAVIADAERKQEKDEAVRLWLRWLRDVVYDAEDVIDEFSYETTRLRERRRLKYKVRDFVNSSNPLDFRCKLARKIKGINNKLDQITKDMDRFQLKTISTCITVHGESSERRSRQTTSFASQSQIVGREVDKDKIIKLLTTHRITNNHLEKVPVVSIVGMGGLGKTTLAQLVYNDDSVKKHFEPKIWVCVSDDFDVHRLLSDIMESVTREKFNRVSNFDVLVHKVREELTEKRYLLVLDDLWNEDAEQWETLLQSSLIVGAPGSKILITTRKRQVADVVNGSISPYLLERLQADECWSIMERKAFAPGGALKTPRMINIGKEIANKCSGLPLAAKFLGSLMHSKNKESNWLSIRENDMWNTHESPSKIIPVLKLSYDNLPPYLQRCFSYCSIFPKGWKLSKRTLIQLWMAEGFLQPTNMGNNCSFEDIGDDYFESLLWSSFFDGVEKNDLGDVMTFKVHDLVHDLAQSVVGDHECSTVKVTDHLEVNSEVRRLSLTVDKKFSGSCKSISSIKKLRTIIVLEPKYRLSIRRLCNKRLRILHLGRLSDNGCSSITYDIYNSKLLRYFHISNLDLWSPDSMSKLYNLQTLVLSNCSPIKYVLNEEMMGSSKHLRYLDISFTDIKKLPHCVTSLHHLQQLDLSHCKKFTTFPNSVMGLECLRFLDMSFTAIETIPDSVTRLCNLRTLDVNSCEKLKTLPEYVAGLKNLSIFNFKYCPLLEALPKDFGALSQLRYLSLAGTKIRVMHGSFGNLHNLEYVDLSLCEIPNEVTNWIKLRKLYYQSSGTPVGLGKLIMLQELSYRVREKVINEYEPERNDGIEELGNLNSLEEINIRNLENVKDPIDAEKANLKGKQNLRLLVLSWDVTGEDLEKSCSFQVFEALQPPTCLRVLYIYSFMGWDLPTWISGGTLLNLDRLVIDNCAEITQLPAAIGQLPRLKYLSLTDMSLESLDICGFPSLIELILTDIFLLEELCYSYPCLQYLRINGCENLKEVPSFPSLHTLVLDMINPKLLLSVGRSQTSLTIIWLENLEKLTYFPISIIQNNRNLQDLYVGECNQLEGFGVNDDENESTVAELYGDSLQVLTLVDCPVLKFLPDLRGWTSLQKLTIFNCPQVKEYLTYDLKSLSFLQYLYVDFIQRKKKRRDPSSIQDLINLMKK